MVDMMPMLVPLSNLIHIYACLMATHTILIHVSFQECSVWQVSGCCSHRLCGKKMDLGARSAIEARFLEILHAPEVSTMHRYVCFAALLHDVWPELFLLSNSAALGIPTPQAMEAKTNSIDLETAETAASDGKTLKENASVDLASSASSVFRRGGIFPTAICLSKAAIGAGRGALCVGACCRSWRCVSTHLSPTRWLFDNC